MSWRLAHSLETLRAQVNAKWPARSKDSDGSIGDEHHSARSSDHNPDAHGVVRAIDLTHDPAHGFDSYHFADLILAMQDPRLKYVISNGRIGSGHAGPAAGGWRRYSGINPHNHHCHISVVADAHGDDPHTWDIGGYQTGPVDENYTAPPSTLRRGANGPDVQRLQSALHVFIDGQFGPATERAVKVFQAGHGLVVDGIAGPQTWLRLEPKGDS